MRSARRDLRTKKRSRRAGPSLAALGVSEPLTTNGSLARQRAGHFFAGIGTFPVLSYTVGTEGPQEPSFRRRGAGRAISRGLRGGKPEWSTHHPGDSHALLRAHTSARSNNRNLWFSLNYRRGAATLWSIAIR